MRTLITAALASFALVALVGCSNGTSSPSPSPAGVTVTGIVEAGPVCPVERPGDAACDPRPVEGARISIVGSAGSEVAHATSAVDGSFEVSLPPGEYELIPQAVEGILGTAPPIHIQVRPGGAVTPSPIELEYDTGIR